MIYRYFTGQYSSLYDEVADVTSFETFIKSISDNCQFIEDQCKIVSDILEKLEGEAIELMKETTIGDTMLKIDKIYDSIKEKGPNTTTNCYELKDNLKSLKTSDEELDSKEKTLASEKNRISFINEQDENEIEEIASKNRSRVFSLERRIAELNNLCKELKEKSDVNIEVIEEFNSLIREISELLIPLTIVMKDSDFSNFMYMSVKDQQEFIANLSKRLRDEYKKYLETMESKKIITYTNVFRALGFHYSNDCSPTLSISEYYELYEFLNTPIKTGFYGKGPVRTVEEIINLYFAEEYEYKSLYFETEQYGIEGASIFHASGMDALMLAFMDADYMEKVRTRSALGYSEEIGYDAEIQRINEVEFWRRFLSLSNKSLGDYSDLLDGTGYTIESVDVLLNDPDVVQNWMYDKNSPLYPLFEKLRSNFVEKGYLKAFNEFGEDVMFEQMVGEGNVAISGLLLESLHGNYYPYDQADSEAAALLSAYLNGEMTWEQTGLSEHYCTEAEFWANYEKGLRVAAENPDASSHYVIALAQLEKYDNPLDFIRAKGYSEQFYTFVESVNSVDSVYANDYANATAYSTTIYGLDKIHDEIPFINIANSSGFINFDSSSVNIGSVDLGINDGYRYDEIMKNLNDEEKKMAAYLYSEGPDAGPDKVREYLRARADVVNHRVGVQKATEFVEFIDSRETATRDELIESVVDPYGYLTPNQRAQKADEMIRNSYRSELQAAGKYTPEQIEAMVAGMDTSKYEVKMTSDFVEYAVDSLCVMGKGVIDGGTQLGENIWQIVDTTVTRTPGEYEHLEILSMFGDPESEHYNPEFAHMYSATYGLGKDGLQTVLKALPLKSAKAAGYAIEFLNNAGEKAHDAAINTGNVDAARVYGVLDSSINLSAELATKKLTGSFQGIGMQKSTASLASKFIISELKESAKGVNDMIIGYSSPEEFVDRMGSKTVSNFLNSTANWLMPGGDLGKISGVNIIDKALQFGYDSLVDTEKAFFKAIVKGEPEKWLSDVREGNPVEFVTDFTFDTFKGEVADRIETNQKINENEKIVAEIEKNASEDML